MSASQDRREFLKTTTLAVLGASAIPSMANATTIRQSLKKLDENDIILFQGDSITDAGRDKSRYYANDAAGMGNGYVYQIVSELLGTKPEQKIRFYNRGISGHKVYQLAERWDDDCLNLKPDILSILTGVNDFWHTLSWNYQGSAKKYEEDFRKLLDRTLTRLPDLKLIIGEPFAVTGGTAITSDWDKDFPAYRKAAASIAGDYKAAFIPYQEIFEKALKVAPVSYWCPDGVHPSMAGGYLMKLAWLEAFSRL